MTPLMERVILAMQSLGEKEVSLKQIQQAGHFQTGREVALTLRYLVKHEGMVEVRETGGTRDRPAVWSLTDLGRLYRPLLTLGTPTAATAAPQDGEPTPRKARSAKPTKPVQAGTVADSAQEIKAPRDAAVPKALDPARDPRRSPEPAWLKEACRRFEQDAAAATAERDPKPEPRLDLTLGSDGMLEIVVPGSDFSMLLTPGQTSQLGEFLTKTAGVWQCSL